MKKLKGVAFAALLGLTVPALAYTHTQTWSNTVSVIAFSGGYSQLRGYTFTASTNSCYITWKGYSSPNTGVNYWDVQVWDESGGGTGTKIYDSGNITVTGSASSPGSASLTIALTAGHPYLISLNDHGYGSSSGTWSYLYSTYTQLQY